MIAADVAGVQDRIHAGQRGQRLGTDQAVRVGNDADPRPRCSLSSPRSSPGSAS
jgi:hypothetical protein